MLVAVSQVLHSVSSLTFVRIQRRKTDFLIMDSCGDVRLRAVSTEVFCSSVLSAAHHILAGPKDEIPQQMLAFWCECKKVFAYILNV